MENGIGNCNESLLSMLYAQEVCYGRKHNFSTESISVIERALKIYGTGSEYRDEVRGYGRILTEPIISEDGSFLIYMVGLYTGLTHIGNALEFKENDKKKSYVLLRLKLPIFAKKYKKNETILIRGNCFNLFRVSDEGISFLRRESGIDSFIENLCFDVYATCTLLVKIGDKDAFGSRSNIAFERELKTLYKSLEHPFERTQLCVNMVLERIVVSEGYLYCYLKINNGLTMPISINKISVNISEEKHSLNKYISAVHFMGKSVSNEIINYDNLSEYQAEFEDMTKYLTRKRAFSEYREVSYRVPEDVEICLHNIDAECINWSERGKIGNNDSEVFCIKVPCTIFPTFDISFYVSADDNNHKKFLPFKPFRFNIEFA